MDPSYRNWGYSVGELDPNEGTLELTDVGVIQPVSIESKQVRTSSKDLDRTEQLVRPLIKLLKEADAIFVEVPVGSKSASAMKGYGVCIGVLGALRALGYAFVEVTPMDVKLISVGSKTASKKQMIEWAVGSYPDAPWPRQTVKGVTSVIASKAEHMADSVAAIHAGAQTPEFQRMLPAFRRAAK